MQEILRKTLFSTRLMAVLFLVFATAMAFGTFVESWYSTETARIWIYNAWWFEAIMAFFLINFIGNIKRYNLLKKEKWAVLTLHLSWILIIVGAFVTRYISYEGMMPIREGKSSNIFYSDKTYLTLFVDGDIDGEMMRRTFQSELMVTSEALKTNLPWDLDFNGQKFSVSYIDFIEGAKKGFVRDPDGKEYLKVVESGGGGRHDHYLESGTVTSIHNVLFALNKPTEGAINIIADGSDYQIQSPFDGGFMRMSDQLKGSVVPDSLQSFYLRSLYTVAGMQFVVPEPITIGKYDVVAVPEEEKTDATPDALIVEIAVAGETVQAKLLGGKGSANFSDQIRVGELDFSLSFGSKIYQLPFNIQLNDFIAEKYPGTEKGYSSFMSKITVNDERSFDYDIYMNHVLDHRGYRFFQASFDQDEKGTVLSVNHDQWGTWITYIGYFLLYLGLLGIMFYGKTRFKELANTLEKLRKKRTKLAAVLVFFLYVPLQGQEVQQGDGHIHTEPPSQEEVDSLINLSRVPEDHAALFGELVIQDDGGRMKPVNTFASELLRKLSFKDAYKDLDANQVFLSMMLNPALWYNNEFIALDKKAQNDSIRSIIGIPKGKKFIKATDFFDDKGNNKLGPYLQEAFATNTPNKFQSDFKDAYFRLSLLDRALSGEIVKIFPLKNDENNKWISAVEYRSGQYQVADSLYANFIQNGVPYYLMSLRKGLSTGDYAEAEKILEAFHKNQADYGSEVLPAKQKVKAEIIYNKLDIFNRLYKWYALVGILMFFVLIFRIFKDREIWKIATYFFKGIIIIFFLWHTGGLIMRWYISGHAPWSDAYESILYVSWATMAMGLSLGRKSDITIAATAFVSSMLLWIAHQSWVDPSIANLVPVLDSYWLMIHVAVIVGSYGPLTVGMILGIVALLLIILTNKRNKKRMEHNLKELTVINELAITVGLIMLTIGNFLGGQWANESWGRYWGWDPKETWALISIMVYAFVLHARLVPGLRGRWTFNFLSIVAFGSIMMTYFGVNFYLVGLHSYASGDQVITPTFVWYTVLGILILGAISFWRYRVNYRNK
ncbi:cytochrome c biogenesis protein CcsA [Flavobacteriaceae bacterium D16]|nr:cytochrome c biogenesis protein CcsA [Flavobacteriaceae bacterium D16]